MTETILLALILIPCLIIAIVFHEVAHGYVAMLLGDPTAKERRRTGVRLLLHVRGPPLVRRGRQVVARGDGGRL